MRAVFCSHVRAGSTRVIVALIFAMCTTSCGAGHESQSTQFCAIMADGVGLYVGNPVTQMGYKIGTVDRITTSDNSVEVRFNISEHRPLPADVKAVTRSASILADRSLELMGNYSSGPQLVPGQCIPRSHSATPLSLSQIIGSATDFVNGVNPQGSTNIRDALRGIDEALQGNGAGLSRLLTMSSSLSDHPDQAISDIGTIIRNIAKLTAMLKASRAPLKEIVEDMPETTPDLVNVSAGATNLIDTVDELVFMIADVEKNLGDDIQLALDTFGDFLRHLSPHSKGVANMLNPVPRFANTLSYYVNNHQFDLLAWSPPLFRIRTPDGLALCGAMNASMPGSCADVNGQPHAVDIALLQYVLTKAQRP
jgi:phospholipid/cholesterol/gamma-HCH transport system substrate-binding protein